MTDLDLNHQKIRVPGDPHKRVCRLCAAHFDETIQGVCPSRLARFLHPSLLTDSLIEPQKQ